ncbi:hypothetical protein C5167_012202 [Papaver somniferum]|uniref:Tyrosinase copper-binding domain-containing protein n=1 Tax=Papaver somniferum TaxID=3469 RepID=A0A4Y7IZW6_PAPSO|nr:hypothetical protein C5167_012202 [Papaver somniferum]
MSLSLLATTTISSPTTSSNPLRNSRSNTRRFVNLPNCAPYTIGIYGTTAAIATNNNAVGAPLVPPDLAKCHLATDTSADPANQKIGCCPPYSTAQIVDFKPPSSEEPLRVRKAAHKYNADDIEKFEAAIAKLKALTDDDPWSYKQQATIHCTYYNGAFDQLNSNTILQIHGSWFFLPWHRYYLYFWERILGKLIGDDTFAIPFWNWDTPKGMYMPPIPEPLAWTTISRKYKKLTAAAKKRSEGASLKLSPVSEDEKGDAVEVLVIEGIDAPHGSPARFDIYVAKPIEGLVGPHNGELAGSFVKVPHAQHASSNNSNAGDSSLELGISTLLEEIEAEGSEKLVASLVPRNGEVVVGGVRVELFNVDDDDEDF